MVPPREYAYELWIQQEQGVSIKGEGKKLDTEADATDLIHLMKSCPSLKFLELEGNTLGIDGAKGIGKILESKPEFEAALWKDLFTGRLKTEIPQALLFLFGGIDLAKSRLQRLDLSDNAIGPVGMEGLKPFFKSSSAFSLKELILNNNGLGPEGGSTFAACLLNCLRQSRTAGGEKFSLKVFVCGRNRLENKAAAKLGEFFEEMGSLEEVHMPQNGIYVPGITALCKGFRANTSLRVLNLNDNTVRSDGGLLIADLLKSLSLLEELNLGDCLLKNSGALSIVKSSSSLKHLHTLNLESNEIGGPTGMDISNLLRNFPSISSLNLGCNEFGETAVDHIQALLANLDELMIEDDNGEQSEQEEEEGEEEEEEDEEDEEESKLDTMNEHDSSNISSTSNSNIGNTSNVSNASNGGLFSNISDTSITTPTKLINEQIDFDKIFTNSMCLKPKQVDPVETFLNQPSFESLDALKPDPFGSLLNYILASKRSVDDSIRVAELSISSAFGISNLGSLSDKPEMFDIFVKLLLTAKEATSVNFFCTYVIVQLGLMKGEDKKLKDFNSNSVEALNMFVEKEGQNIHPAYFRCLSTFLNIPNPNFDANLEASKNLLSSVTKLAATPPELSISFN